MYSFEDGASSNDNHSVSGSYAIFLSNASSFRSMLCFSLFFPCSVCPSVYLENARDSSHLWICPCVLCAVTPGSRKKGESGYSHRLWPSFKQRQR